MKKALLSIVLIILVFFAFDFILEKIMTPYIRSSGQVFLNCYEIVRRDHPEKVWDKVFFGNSIAISTYREEESASGYINAGINCGLMTDLWDMIRTNEIQIGSELVITFNSALSLYDDFMYDPTNPWRRKWYQPYCYFERDRLRLLVKNFILTYVFKKNKPDTPYKNQIRELYFGVMSQKELNDKLAGERFLVYYNIQLEDMKKNIYALKKITDYCKRHKIRLRFVWVPPNPTVKQFSATPLVYNFINVFSIENDIEFLDLTGKFDKECYYDQGHFNYEYGAHVFTKEIEPWLTMKE